MTRHVVRFTVYGKLASMKNRRVPSKHNPFVTHVNKDCRAFKRDFMAQVPRSACKALGSLKQPLRATVTVFYPTFQSDVDCAYVYDLLQEAGVVRNDRYIRVKVEDGSRVDKKNPRVEIELEEL